MAVGFLLLRQGMVVLSLALFGELVAKWRMEENGLLLVILDVGEMIDMQDGVLKQLEADRINFWE